MIDPGEDCDGTNLNNQTCATATMGAFTQGNLACAPDNSCKFDMRGCTAANGAPAPSTAGTQTPPPGPGSAGSTGTIDNGTGGGPGTSSGSGGDTGTIPPITNGGSTGTGTAGSGPGPTGAAGAAPQGSMDPIIPMDPGDCPTWQNGTITYQGLAGIQIAAGAKPAGATAPMLIYWHGTGSTSGEYAFMAAPVAQGVTAAGGVIVSFQGTTGGDLYSGTSIFGAGDMKLVDGLVACAVKDHGIDTRKIYVMGCSAGGLFSVAMAAMRSNYIAAAAPNSGGVTVPPAFENAHVPPLMTVHGAMGSDVVIVDFSQTSASADTLFKGKGGFVIDCNTGGGHCGGAGLAGDAWTFFQAHTFGVSPEPWASGLPAGFSSQCKIQ
jgi:dienelactone hydrolase